MKKPVKAGESVSSLTCRKALSVLLVLILLSPIAVFINELHLKIHCALPNSFYISCSRMFARWSWFETALGGLRELLSFGELAEISLFSFSVSSLFLFPYLSSLLPVLKPPRYPPFLFQFLWTSNTLVTGTHVLSVSLARGRFLRAVNHTSEVLSTTTHRSLCIITESINKGIHHWFLTCKEYAMAYENISIFNSFLKVTQKQMITMQGK